MERNGSRVEETASRNTPVSSTTRKKGKRTYVLTPYTIVSRYLVMRGDFISNYDRKGGGGSDSHCGGVEMVVVRSHVWGLLLTESTSFYACS